MSEHGNLFIVNDLRELSYLAALYCIVSYLESTLKEFPQVFDSKRLTKILNALESTLTKTGGRGPSAVLNEHPSLQPSWRRNRLLLPPSPAPSSQQSEHFSPPDRDGVITFLFYGRMEKYIETIRV